MLTCLTSLQSTFFASHSTWFQVWVAWFPPKVSSIAFEIQYLQLGEKHSPCPCWHSRTQGRCVPAKTGISSWQVIVADADEIVHRCWACSFSQSVNNDTYGHRILPSWIPYGHTCACARTHARADTHIHTQAHTFMHVPVQAQSPLHPILFWLSPSSWWLV